jgi:hypothetical protein
MAAPNAQTLINLHQTFRNAVAANNDGITQAQRVALHDFWRQVRGTVVALQDEIQNLRDVARYANLRIEAPRPDTSNSAVALRQIAEWEMDMDASAIQRANSESTTIAEISAMSVQEAQNCLGAMHIMGPFGCWVNNNAAAHANGYKKINLRNSINPRTGAKYSCQPFLHQLAVVAAGFGNRLYLCSGNNSSHQVSYHKKPQLKSRGRG